MGGRQTTKECSVQRFLHVEIYRVVIMWPVITLFSHSSSCWCDHSSVCLLFRTRVLSCFFLVSLFCAWFHAIRQQWFRTSMGDCIPFSSRGFEWAWPWYRRWSGISSPLAAQRELNWDLITGRHVEASSSFVFVDQLACWAVYQAIQPRWEMQWP